MGPSSLDFEGLSKKSQLKDTELIRQRGKERGESTRSIPGKGNACIIKNSLGNQIMLKINVCLIKFGVLYCLKDTKIKAIWKNVFG